MDAVAGLLAEMGYRGLKAMDFCEWRDRILADPETFKSWSFCTSLAVEGDGIDSMAGTAVGAKAMREAVGAEAFDAFDPRRCLEKMLRYCQVSGLLPLPEAPSVHAAAVPCHEEEPAAPP